MSGRTSWRTKALLILGMIGAATLLPSGAERSGGPRLIAFEPLPASGGPMCVWTPADGHMTLTAALQQGAVLAAQRQGAGAAAPARPDEASRLAASRRPHVRMIRDPYPEFSSVAVDPIRNEVVFTDENLFNVMVFDRTTNTPPTAAFSEPKRQIGGPRTKLEFECGVYIDPATGDIYTVSNDIGNMVKVFSREAKGDVPADRELYTPHGTFGIAVDEDAQELYLTVQHDPSVVVFPKMAEKDAPPIRLLQGDRTGLADPHGIALDPKGRLMFVANHGSFHSKVPGGKGSTRGGGRALNKPNWPVGDGIPGSGKNLPPSITIHALDARGDAAPLRTIQGPSTQLNMPTGLFFDPRRNELFVANDNGHSILVFSATAGGNVAPVRVLKGPKSLISNPTSVFVDTKNDEMWVTNYGNHTATVYRSTAQGDTPPLRVIRSAPMGMEAAMIGNPGAIAYDSKRDELLVPS